MRFWIPIIWLLVLNTCYQKTTLKSEVVIAEIKAVVVNDTMPKQPVTPILYPRQAAGINTGATTPEELLSFAKTLIGTPYKYASTDPSIGFDCSGFITYVFNHFNIAVPRSSVDFTNVPKEVALGNAKPGDLILFTGTDSTIRVVGHMGIIISQENGQYNFIHSTSGKAMGVTISPVSNYYFSRFVKVIRIFPQNDL